MSNYEFFKVVQGYLDQAAKTIALPEHIALILSQPKNEIIVHFPVKMDDGTTKLMTGYRFQHNNDAIMGYMMKEAGKQRIDTYMGREDCRITTRETSRTIECAYKRTIEILPGWKHTFTFTPSADQPLI